MRRILILLAVAIVTSLAVSGASAHAGSTTREAVPIDETFAFNDCGFAVIEHDSFTLHFKTWYDSAGVHQRQLVTATSARITWTNPVTGASVSTANPFVVHKTFNADGTVTIAFTGLFIAIHGAGPAYVDSGRDLIVFSPDTGVEVLTSAGPSDDLCEALAATIA